MLQILKNNLIKLTRGDTAVLKVEIYDEVVGRKYTVQDTDVLKLSVKSSIEDNNYVFQKVVTGTDTIVIEPKDTKQASFGRYKYDVQLEKHNGDVSTIIPPSVFEILEEVTV